MTPSEIEAIRERHEAQDEMWKLRQAMSPRTSVDAAHADRATLLRLLDAERARRVEGEAINTNDLRDYADQISNPYAQFILDAASQLDYARTDRNILQAELDAERARRVEVEGALAEVKAGAENTIDFYNRNGPQWTSRETGQEYYSASYVMGSAKETIALIGAALGDWEPVRAALKGAPDER
jgi:hypothetical protein